MAPNEASDPHLDEVAQVALDELERSLDPGRFARVHRSYIVAIRAIASVRRRERLRARGELRGGIMDKNGNFCKSRPLHGILAHEVACGHDQAARWGNGSRRFSTVPFRG